MSVTNGANADAATLNGAYVSKTSDSTVISKLTLNRTASGSQVTDVQSTINDHESRITQNETDIATNESAIASNASDISTLQSSLPLHNFTASSAPTVGDDVADGYSAGSMWLDATAVKFYLCVDNSSGAADWREMVLYV